MRSSCMATLALLVSSLVAVGQTLRHVSIQTDNANSVAEQLGAAGYDVLEDAVTTWSVDLIVSGAELDMLHRLGYRPRVIRVGRPFRKIQQERQADGMSRDVAPSGYPDLTEVLSNLNAASTIYGEICQLVDLTTTYNVPATFEGRHMYAVKISDNVAQDEDEPAFLIVSCHHGREIITPVMALYAIEQFTTQYGIDPTITALVNEYEIWVSPIWNPDGYEYAFNVDNLWRKNRRVFEGGVGVELNRNYPFGWDGPCAGDTNPSSGGYKGPSPASESETQTMIALSQDRRFAKVLDFHTSGLEVLWGYQCLAEAQPAFLLQQAQDLSNAFGFNGRTRPPSAEGEHYEWQSAMMGAQSNLIELGGSQPPYADALQEAQARFPGVLFSLQRNTPLSGRVTDAISGEPAIATISFPEINYENGETNSSGGRFGRYHIFLPDGPATVDFAAEGYRAQQHVIDISNAVPQTLDVQLVPSALDIRLVDGPAGVVNANDSLGVLIEVTAAAENPVPSSVSLFYRYNTGSFLEIPLSTAGGEFYADTLPSTTCGPIHEYYFSAEGDQGTIETLPSNAPTFVFTFAVGEPRDVIDSSSIWRYFKGTQEPSVSDLTAWTVVGFDDSTWFNGVNGFGYGSDCDPFGTTLSDMQGQYVSLYARHLFDVADPDSVIGLTLTVDYDDSFVAYINGMEVGRNNVTGDPPVYSQVAQTDHECSGSPGNANVPDDIPIDAVFDPDTLLVSGTNVLAIQAHNLTLDSSDFTLLATLRSVECSGCAANADCDDGIECTADTCDLILGCQHVDVCPVGEICDFATSLCLEDLADPPTVESVGSRYLAVTPPADHLSVALRVDSADIACLPRYVDENGRLVDAPVFQSSNAWGTVFVGDEEILPLTLYEVRADVRLSGEPENLSDAVSATTWMWADANNDLDVDIFDIVCVLDGFDQIYGQCTLHGDDLRGDLPDRDVNIFDIVSVLDAFDDVPYPSAPCSGPAAAPFVAGGEPVPVTLVAQPAVVRPGGLVSVEVYAERAVNVRGYEIALTIEGGGSRLLTLESLEVEPERQDHVFDDVTSFNTSSLSSGRLASAGMTGTIDSGTRVYLGTFTYRVSAFAMQGAKLSVTLGDGSVIAKSGTVSVGLELVTPARFQIIPQPLIPKSAKRRRTR